MRKLYHVAVDYHFLLWYSTKSRQLTESKISVLRNRDVKLSHIQKEVTERLLATSQDSKYPQLIQTLLIEVFPACSIRINKLFLGSPSRPREESCCPMPSNGPNYCSGDNHIFSKLNLLFERFSRLHFLESRLPFQLPLKPFRNSWRRRLVSTTRLQLHWLTRFCLVPRAKVMRDVVEVLFSVLEAEPLCCATLLTHVLNSRSMSSNLLSEEFSLGYLLIFFYLQL